MTDDYDPTQDSAGSYDTAIQEARRRHLSGEPQLRYFSGDRLDIAYAQTTDKFVLDAGRIKQLLEFPSQRLAASDFDHAQSLILSAIVPDVTTAVRTGL
jgi:hypothetical protein